MINFQTFIKKECVTYYKEGKITFLKNWKRKKSLLLDYNILSDVQGHLMKSWIPGKASVM